MKLFYQEFLNFLDEENKEKAIFSILNLLEEQKITVEELYEEILIPSMKNYYCQLNDPEVCVWKEHIRSSIIRTIIECTYPYLIKRKAELNHLINGQKVLIVSPSNELHEIGGMIINHYFILAGFTTQYIGVNTPKKDILSAIKTLNPDMVALSVTNYYNLFVTKEIIDEIKSQFKEVKIIIGGQAFEQMNATTQLSFDYHIRSYEEIVSLSQGVSL